MWCDVMWCDVMCSVVIWYDMIWYDMIWYDMLWCCLVLWYVWFLWLWYIVLLYYVVMWSVMLYHCNVLCGLWCVVVCLKCSGVHRNLGVDHSFVQSASRDQWSLLMNTATPSLVLLHLCCFTCAASLVLLHLCSWYCPPPSLVLLHLCCWYCYVDAHADAYLHVERMLMLMLMLMWLADHFLYDLSRSYIDECLI